MRIGVTIGQAAAFAGVTVKTVRHYHRLGLLAEPPRDGSGYRRYGSVDLLRLVQVRTLAEAGVPLADVGSLLTADTEGFTVGVAEVERKLTARIESLLARRAMVRQLTDGNRLLLPDRAVAILARFAELGYGDDYVCVQRESLVLLRALAPESLDRFLGQMERRLADPEFVALERRCLAAESWSPGDPRIEPLADAMVRHLLANPGLLGEVGVLTASRDADGYAMVSYHREDQWPASARLTALIESGLRRSGIDLPHS